MKRLFTLLLCCLVFCAASMADTVLQMPYTFTIGGEQTDGLYTGEVQNGIPEGYGLFVADVTPDQPWHYVGAWSAGLMSGSGGLYYDNGTTYIGIFANGVFLETQAAAISVPPATAGSSYVGNSNTMKFHYASCGSVKVISEEHKVYFSDRDSAISQGYVPCKRCHP